MNWWDARGGNCDYAILWDGDDLGDESRIRGSTYTQFRAEGGLRDEGWVITDGIRMRRNWMFGYGIENTAVDVQPNRGNLNWVMARFLGSGSGEDVRDNQLVWV